MTQTPWTQQHIEYVEHVDLARQRGGYLADDVDRQLRRVVTLMRAGKPVPQVAATALRRTRLREGYVPARVEAVFDQVVSWQHKFDAIQLPEPSAPGVRPAAGTQSAAPVAQGGGLKWTRQQQEWVRESTFTKRSGSRAYVTAEVDDFLDKVLVAMAKGEPLPEIASVQFYPPRFGTSGYDAVVVDEFLDQLGSLRPAL
ncbi:DivIVA domain-containing protein [Leekyejoonella antrihumi]|uniref:DivIVA domain-containing protein n=1 Tax=Leekyejoonella antrihumi TaxID=1660198 RepID=A0A563E669_9MICO|nr:DivIVA domain-containing protein [Leekyejoonella antrihumi]TWP37925.1 DivIVA domain-containing protein [Leekyejoonella antrihumi]